MLTLAIASNHTGTLNTNIISVSLVINWLVTSSIFQRVLVGGT